jgi:hypothetical protein
MDGKLDDRFWEDLPVYQLKENKTGVSPETRTSFRVAWASNALYLGISCEEPDAWKLNKGAGNGDDPDILKGDHVNVLIEADGHSCYQLAVNPYGAVFDADRTAGVNTGWSSGARVAAHTGKDTWSLEVQFPIVPGAAEQADTCRTGLPGVKPGQNFPWDFNLCRQRVREAGTEHSAFSPTGGGDLYDRMKFGKLYIRN